MRNYDHLAGITHRKRQTRSGEVSALEKMLDRREWSGASSSKKEPTYLEKEKRRARNKRRKVALKRKKKMLGLSLPIFL